jgi:hypothetical protein
MTKILLISGKAQSGKDSTANILQKHHEEKGLKSVVIHYGDFLKYVCAKYFGWNGKKDEEGRQTLQQIGTNYARKNYPTIWVDVVILCTKALFKDYDYVVVPDFRFPDEYKRWLDEDYSPTTIRVERLNFDNGLTEEQKNHPSEVALDNFNFHYKIESKSGLDNLEFEVNKFIDEL